MRTKEQACTAWREMCKNCSNHEEFFAGVCSAIWENTMPYIDRDLKNSSLQLLSPEK